jgi:hypothetical protein
MLVVKVSTYKIESLRICFRDSGINPPVKQGPCSDIGVCTCACQEMIPIEDRDIVSTSRICSAERTNYFFKKIAHNYSTSRHKTWQVTHQVMIPDRV